MNTTALLVDILIVGVQALVWIAGLLFTFFINPNSVIQLLNNYPTSFLFIAIVIAYTLGIVFEYLSAIVFGWFKSKEEKELFSDVKIVKIVAYDREIHNFLDNQYGRLRIARGTIFNIPFLIIAACFFVSKFNIGFRFGVFETVVFIVTFGIVFMIFAIISWRRRNGDYMNYIKHVKEHMTKQI